MMTNGPSWFPTTYNHPYPDYPATSTFLIYVSAHLFGGLNKFTAVLPTAIAAAITVLLTYLIGALRSVQLGLFAVFFMFLTFAFFKAARSISLDMYPTLITAACFYLICSADEKNKPARRRWVYPLLLLGFVFRGPIGLVIPAGVVCTYYLLDRRFKLFFITGGVALFILLLCTTVLLAIAYHAGGAALMQAVLRMEVLGRMGSSALPFYFYFTDSLVSFALSYPLALLTMAGCGYYAFLKRYHLTHGDFILKIIGWLLVILIGMSIPGDKKVRYILPIAPALALLAAYPFIALPIIGLPGEKYFIRLRTVLITLFLYLPSLFFLTEEIVFYYQRKQGIDFNIDYLLLIVMLMLLQFVSLQCWYRYINKVMMRETAVLFIAALSFVVLEIMMIEPIEFYIDRTHEFVTAIEAERVKSHAALVFYKENPDGLPIKYLINMPKRENPIFISNESELTAFSSPAFFVTSVNYFMALPVPLLDKLHIVGSEKVGHNRVVVFTKENQS